MHGIRIAAFIAAVSAAFNSPASILGDPPRDPRILWSSSAPSGMPRLAEDGPDPATAKAPGDIAPALVSSTVPCPGPKPGAPHASTLLLSCDPNPDGAWFQIPFVQSGGYQVKGIFDDSRDRFVIFSESENLWELSLGNQPQWRRLCAKGLPPGGILDAVYDPVRNRMLSYGLHILPQPDAYEADLWELSLGDTITWRRLGLPSVGLEPSPIDPHASSVAYDPQRDRAYLLGYVGPWRKVWCITLGGVPSIAEIASIRNDGDGAIYDETLVFDARRDRLLVFGGYSRWFHHGLRQVHYSDIHEVPLDGSGGWRRISPLGALPPGRVGATVALEPARDRLLVAGGNNDVTQLGYATLNDAWAFSLSGTPVWTKLTPTPSPLLPFFYSPGSFSASRDAFVGFGGYPRDAIWSVPIEPGAAPEPLVSAVVPPSPYVEMAAVYDSQRRRFIVHGGGYGPDYDPGTWALALGGEGFSWCGIGEQGGGSELMNHTAVYDVAGDRLIVYGGRPPSFYPRDDVWELGLSDPRAWRRLEIPGAPAPPPREGHVAILDPLGRRMVIFGGWAPGPSVFGDVWALDLQGDGGWTRLDAEGTGPAPGGAKGVYDPDRHRMIVVSGRPPGVWELSLGSQPAWRRLLPEGQGPATLTYPSAVFDDTRGRLVLHDHSAGGTWELALDPPRWRRLQPAGGQPHLWRHASAYDLEGDALLAFHQRRTYILRWGNPARKVEIDLRPGSPNDAVPARSRGRVQVAIMGAPGFDVVEIDAETLRLPGAGVVRDGKGRVWTSFRDVNQDSRLDLVVAFPAESVYLGRPDHKLVLRGRTRDGQWLRGEGAVRAVPRASVSDLDERSETRPVPTRTAIRCVSQNPTRGREIELAVDLATDEPAVIEGIDVAGRRVFARRLDDLSVGAHRLTILVERTWSAGIYFIRLRQGTETQIVRLAVIP